MKDGFYEFAHTNGNDTFGIGWEAPAAFAPVDFRFLCWEPLFSSLPEVVLAAVLVEVVSSLITRMAIPDGKTTTSPP